MSDQLEEGHARYELVPPEETGDTPALYANFFQATVSPVDVTLHLGWYAIPPLMAQPTEPVKVPVRPILKVSLPIGLVSGMIQVLQLQLAAWEDAQAASQATQAEGTDS